MRDVYPTLSLDVSLPCNKEMVATIQIITNVKLFNNIKIMGDSKVFMFPDNNSGTTNGLDPNLLLALNNNGLGGNGNWMWVMFLFFLYPLLRNNGLGYGIGDNGANGCAHGGVGYLSNMINNNDGRQLLDAAINRNGCAIDKLQGMFGCGKDAIISAINGVQQAVATTSNQTNMNIADIKYALSLGNKDIAQQLASCCCNLRESITQGNYQNQLQTVQQTNQLMGRIDQLANGVTQGFSATAYETAQQTCALQNGLRDQTQTILNKLDSIEDARKDREINQLTAALAAKNAQAERQAELAPIVQQLNDIRCKQPNTVTVPYQPFVTVPNCVAWNAAYGTYPQNGSIWS